MTEIGDYAFYNCKSLSRIEIPSSIVKVGIDAFKGCSHLYNIYVSDLVAWCNISFSGSYSVPGSDKSSCSSFYLNNILIENLVIPNGVENILDYSFMRFGFKSVSISDSVTSIGKRSFYNCLKLENMVFSNTLYSIGDSAFYSCGKLYSITIPSSVKIIAGSAFELCSNLSTIHISDLTAWCNISFESTFSVPGAKSGKPSLYLNDDKIDDLIIPSDVTEIKQYAFCYFQFESVKIPTSVTKIGSYAFLNCNKIVDLVIESISIQIETCAFCNCSALIDITILSSTPPILVNKNAFSSVTATFHVYGVDAYKSADVWKDLTNEFVEITEA